MSSSITEYGHGFYRDENEVVPDRSETVRLQILQLKDSIVASFVTLARLLKEARDEGYAQRWGFPRFGAWIEEGSNLDLSEREAYYLIAVIERAEKVGIPDEELSQVRISSLKQIMSLPEDTNPEHIKELVNEAKTMPYKKVRELVGAIKNEEWVYHTLKFDRPTEDNVYQPALERVRREYGNTMGPDGSPEDITDSRAIEMLCADKNSEPDYEDIEEAEFNDVVDVETSEAA